MGGLGNQMFCYASAYGIAKRIGAELCIDNCSGFSRDFAYRRRYMLNNFTLNSRLATKKERFEPLQVLQRNIARLWSARFPRNSAFRYIRQIGLDYEPDIDARCSAKTVYLDGLWQSFRYFEEFRADIEKQFEMNVATDAIDGSIASMLARADVGAVHYRYFQQGVNGGTENVSDTYYEHAMKIGEEQFGVKKWILFSDAPLELAKKLGALSRRHLLFNANIGPGNEIRDLALLSRAKTLVIANSTFSWWAGWLKAENKVVICPDWEKREGLAAWGFEGLIPQVWIRVGIS